MGGFSAQLQSPQSSAPAGKGAGMSSMQLGQNPIQQSPQNQMMKMQELQMEQPDFAEANQIQPNIQNGTQLGGLGGALGGQMNPQFQPVNGRQFEQVYGGPVQKNPTITPDMVGTPSQANMIQSSGGPSQGKGSGPSKNIGYPQTTGMMGGQVTLPGQGGQPQLGMPNAYSNTVQPWDNQAKPQSGGGKGFGPATSQSATPMGKGA